MEDSLSPLVGSFHLDLDSSPLLLRQTLFLSQGSESQQQQQQQDLLLISQDSIGSPSSPRGSPSPLLSSSMHVEDFSFSLDDDEEEGERKGRRKRNEKENRPPSPPRKTLPKSRIPRKDKEGSKEGGGDLEGFRLQSNLKGAGGRSTWSAVKKEVEHVKRFESEFDNLGVIGAGEFGTVYKCRNKIDGCLYAIKKSKRPIRGMLDEKNALREVHAHAMLSSMGAHSSIVRYYSVWKEDSHLFIQNELCDMGSLASFGDLTEKKLWQILKQLLEGLKFIHDRGFVHLDIKPGNMFVSSLPPQKNPKGGVVEVNPESPTFLCKIGDFGLMTTLEDPKVEEGDCRYLAREILNGDSSDLPKADVFSLGLSVFELASGLPLPKNGDEWARLRSGDIPALKGYSKGFNTVIKSMLAPEAAARPTATELLLNPLVHQDKEKQCISQLTKELTEERLKTESLERLLKRRSGDEGETGDHKRRKSSKFPRSSTLF